MFAQPGRRRSNPPASIRAIALDVDGVLTDGGFYWGPDGAEWKRFCFADVMGISLARRAGLIVALVSGEDSPLVTRFAHKLGLTDVERHCKDKARAVRGIAARHHIEPADMCFMGDDINDLEAMNICGFAAAPADARPVVREQADLVTAQPGGNGAVRELMDLLLQPTLTSGRVPG